MGKKKDISAEIYGEGDLPTMTPRELEANINYIGQEKAMRKLLVKDELVPVEKIALMTTGDVCEAILETFNVVACMAERIILVKKSDMPVFKNLVKYIDR